MKKLIYKGKIIDLSVETVTLPNGATADLEVITHPGAAAVVPMKDDRTVVMVRQYRHAVGSFIYEIPAGKLHPGEDPSACASGNGRRITRRPVRELLHTPGFRRRNRLQGRPVGADPEFFHHAGLYQ